MAKAKKAAPSQTAAAYREKVVSRHRPHFDYHVRVAQLLEGAARQPRAHVTHVHLVLEMLMLQAIKSHQAVSILAQHGLMEDTAVMARRLMELAIQGGYIGYAPEKERRRRAGRYAAFMWRQLTPELKQRLPPEARKSWVGLGRGYGRFVPAKARKWGPNFSDMFKALGQEKLYRQDYSFLSGIAHGSSDHQVFQFATKTVRLHRDDFVPVLLRYSCRYFLAMGDAWNTVFSVLDNSQLVELAGGLDAVGSSTTGAT